MVTKASLKFRSKPRGSWIVFIFSYRDRKIDFLKFSLIFFLSGFVCAEQNFFSISPGGGYFTFLDNEILVLRNIENSTEKTIQLASSWYNWDASRDILAIQPLGRDGSTNSFLGFSLFDIRENKFLSMEKPIVKPVDGIPLLLSSSQQWPLDLRENFITVLCENPDSAKRIGKYNLVTGEVVCGEVLKNAQANEFLMGDAGSVYLSSKKLSKDGFLISEYSFEPHDQEGKAPLISDYDNQIKFQYPTGRGFYSEPQSKTVWALSNRGRSKTALVKFNANNYSEQLIYQHHQVDIAELILSNDRTEVRFIRVDNNETLYLEPTTETQVGGFAKSKMYQFSSIVEGDILNAYDESADGQRVMLGFEGELGATTVYLWDKNNDSLKMLFSDEGLKIKEDTGSIGKTFYIGEEELPVIYWQKKIGGPRKLALYIHGGPAYRVYASENPVIALLRESGFDVVAPNFRGTPGYGKAWRNQGERNFDGMLQDLNTAAEWYLEENSPKGGIAVVGESFGGMLATALLTDDSIFDYGILLSPGVDPRQVIQNQIERDFRNIGVLIRYFGSLDIKNSPEYERFSSLRIAKAIRKPIYILHGQQDKHVPIEIIQNFVETLKKEKREIHEFFVPEMGHGLNTPNHLGRLSELIKSIEH